MTSKILLAALLGLELGLAAGNCPTDTASSRVLLLTDPIQRRAEFNKALDNPATRRAMLQAALTSSDEVIRLRALVENLSAYPSAQAELLQKFTHDRDYQIQLLIIRAARQLKSPEQARQILIDLGQKSSYTSIKRQVNRLVSSFKFYRRKVRLSEKKDFDYAIKTVKSWRIPSRNWKFLTDPVEQGHLKNFYAPNLDEQKWRSIGQGIWEEQGFADYNGIGWYRIRFKMPPYLTSHAVELFFQAVDEEAWVWLNGRYIGQHTEGQAGWNVPFHLDITEEVRWNAENILVVRVFDSAGAGGIYRPIKVEILK